MLPGKLPSGIKTAWWFSMIHQKIRQKTPQKTRIVSSQVIQEPELDGYGFIFLMFNQASFIYLFTLFIVSTPLVGNYFKNSVKYF